MKNQRIRNLTTGILHTKMEHIYQDIEFITGEEGIMTHCLPDAVSAMEDWLKLNVKDSRFWDGSYDTTHTGTTDLPPMTKAERKSFFEKYVALPRPF